MAESLQPGQRLLVGQQGGHDQVGSHATSAARPGVTIDWASARVAPGQPALDVEALAFQALVMPPASGGTATAAQAGWQQRFVNNLGASTDKAHPNAALRLSLPVSVELAHKVARL